MKPAEFRPAEKYDTNPYYDTTEWPGYIEPTGTIEITENGEVDVTQYAKADVNVESSDGGGEEYNITCVVNSNPSPSVVYPAKATEGKWEKDGDTALGIAQAGQMLIVPKEYTYEEIFYDSDPLPNPPVPVPVTSVVSLDDESVVFVMPAHDIGVVVTADPVY